MVKAVQDRRAQLGPRARRHRVSSHQHGGVSGNAHRSQIVERAQTDDDHRGEAEGDSREAEEGARDPANDADVDLNLLGECLELDELLLRADQQVRRDVDDKRLLSMPQRNDRPLPDDGGTRRHGSRLRVWRDHPEVDTAAQRRLEVPRDGGLSLLDVARRADKRAGDVLARRGRQDQDDAKRFVDVRGLGLIVSVGAGAEVLDHVVEVEARLVLREVHA